MSTTDTILDPAIHELTPSDYEVLFREKCAENEKLQAVLTASRMGAVSEHPQKDAKPAISAERFTAMLGQVQINKLTRSEKLVGIHLDPAGVDDGFLAVCFGRGNNGKAASELFKTSPLRYRQLKEASILLGIYAA